MLLEELFFQVGVILVIAAALSMIVHRLRQPLIIAYILTGILAGPSLFALVKSAEVFDVMSKIGIAFLLFTVGMGLNWRNVKDVGGIAFAIGIGQVIFTSIAGFMLGQFLGFNSVTSAYLAIAFTFSSTIIIVKLLMDKEELDTLYGRISVGFLLVQDFIAMFILLGLGALQGGASAQDVLLQTVLKVLVAIPVLWIVATKLVPPILRYAARSQELLFLFAIAWCFFIAGALHLFGFGIEIGSLLAGITLSGTVFEREINSRIRPLRDFFLVLFFVVLGTHLSIPALSGLFGPILVFSLFILIANPLIVMFILRSLGYHPRTGFLCGTTVAQISEFSFIILAAGIAAGHIGTNVLTLATAVGLITIAVSSSLIQFNETLYEKISFLFRWLEPAKAQTKTTARRVIPKIIMFGFHRVGGPILDTIRKMGQPYMIVDFDPQVIRELSETGEPTMYGDAGDHHFLQELQIEKTKFVISTIPDLTISTTLLGYLSSRDYHGVAIVSARTPDEAKICYKAGATYVIVPTVLGGEKFRELLVEKKVRRASWEKLAQVERDSRKT